MPLSIVLVWLLGLAPGVRVVVPLGLLLLVSLLVRYVLGVSHRCVVVRRLLLLPNASCFVGRSAVTLEAHVCAHWRASLSAAEQTLQSAALCPKLLLLRLAIVGLARLRLLLVRLAILLLLVQ